MDAVAGLLFAQYHPGGLWGHMKKNDQNHHTCWPLSWPWQVYLSFETNTNTRTITYAVCGEFWGERGYE